MVKYINKQNIITNTKMADQNNLFPQPKNVTGDNGYIPRSEDPTIKLNKLAAQAQNLSDFNNIPTTQNTVIEPQYNPVNFYDQQATQVSFQQPNPVYQQPTQIYPQQLTPQYQTNPYPQQPIYPQNQQQYIQPNYTQPQAYNYSQPNSDFSTTFVDPNAPIAPKEEKPKFTFDFKKFVSKYWKFPAAIVLIFSLLGGGFLAFKRFSPPENDPTKFLNVTSEIEAPKSLSQGNPGEWTIKINNNEETSVENLEVELKYDDSFQFIKGVSQPPENLTGNIFKITRLGGVSSGESSGLIKIQGLVTGQVDLDSVMQGRVSYTPSAIASQKDSLRVVDIIPSRTKITSPEIKLTIEPSVGSIQNGGEISFVIKVKNTKQQDYQDLKLRMNYPSGNTFAYSSSQFTNDDTGSKTETPDDGDDTWLISRLPGLSEQTLILKGNVNVKSQQKISFGAELSLKTDKSNYQTLNKVYKDITVSSETLALSTNIDKEDKTFVPGERLKFVINYENKSQTVIKNAEILASIEDKANLLDLKTISFVGGSRPYEINNQIQWTGNNTPQLVTVGPSATGKIEYEVEVKKNVLREKLSQGDYIIRPNVSMKAINLQDVSTAGDVYKMRSNLGFVSTQPEEVKIAKSTNANRKKYKMSWILTSEQNQIDNLIVKSSTKLPPATWQSTLISPTEQAKNLSYNPSNGEIVWKVDKLEPYTGKEGKNQAMINFEIVLELQNQSGLVLLEAPTVSATDNFTGSVFSITGEESKVQQ
jgi:hypothetical protein